MIFFLPKLVETRTSKFNGEIQVLQLLGKYTLVVDGYTQSGGLVTEIWQKTLKGLKDELSNRNPAVLILGLGGGGSALLVNRFWPASRLTAVEIDRVMVKLARRYFVIGNLPLLKIHIADAVSWVRNQAKTRKTKLFDLILVDLYLGSRPSPQSEGKKFLENVKKLLGPGGTVVFNSLIKKGGKSESNSLRKNLDAIFPDVHQIPSPANAVFLARNRHAFHIQGM